MKEDFTIEQYAESLEVRWPPEFGARTQVESWLQIHEVAPAPDGGCVTNTCLPPIGAQADNDTHRAENMGSNVCILFWAANGVCYHGWSVSRATSRSCAVVSWKQVMRT